MYVRRFFFAGGGGVEGQGGRLTTTMASLLDFAGDGVSRGWRMRAAAADFFETRMGRGALSRFSILRGVGSSVARSHLFFRSLHSWQALPSFFPIWTHCVPVFKHMRHALAGGGVSSGYFLFLEEGLFSKKKREK